MFRIKRTKAAPGMPTMPPAVHYATGVAPEGNLTGLSEDQGQAVLVDASTVTKVKAYHARRENVGKLDFEPVGEVQASVPETPSSAVAAARPEPKTSESEKGRKAITK